MAIESKDPVVILQMVIVCLVCLVCLMNFAGCRLDYSRTELTTEMEDSIPETILLNIIQTKVRNGQITSLLAADKIETFKNKNIMKIENMHYQEIGRQGDILTEGWADQTVFYTDSENAEISGKVHFYSQSEQAGIYAENLSWGHQLKLLAAPANEIVTIAQDNGSYVQGCGFQTDLRLKEMTFSGRVNGMSVDEDSNE